ncbi:hypothetical protein BH24ACT3_BH24ACT3_09880 [soil metagenome]
MAAQSWQYDLWRTAFRSRQIGCLALAAAAAAVPAIGPDRLYLAGAVLIVGAIYNLLLQALHQRTGYPHLAMAYFDPIICLSFTLIEPATFVPAVLVMTGGVALAGVAFGRQIAAQSTMIGVVGLVTVTVAVNPDNATVGIIGFLVASSMIAVSVGAVSDGERRLRRRYGSLVENLDAIVWEADPETLTFTYVSNQAERILGWSTSDWLEPGFWEKTIHPDDRVKTVGFCRQAIERGADHEFEYRLLAADGQTAVLHDLVTVTTDGSGQPVRLQGVMVDITARKQTEQRVRQYVDVVEHIQVALLVGQLDLDTATGSDPSQLQLVAANPEAARIAGGGAPEDLIGRRLDQVLPCLTHTELPARVADVFRTGTAFDVDNLFVSTGTVEERVFSAHVFPLPGDLIGISLDDITGASLAADALRHQALHDGLTGLPNRTMLRDRLNQALRRAEREKSEVALMFMDLDQFKEVNDALGHHHGDQLLIALSRRLEEVLRECDVVARLGGDEFALLLTTNANGPGATTVAEKVERALQDPFQIDELSLQTNASIGIALYPEHATDTDTLIQRADVAMYMAKRSGAGHAMYAAELDRSSVRRLTLLGELRRALDFDELVLHYQPTISLRTGRVVRAEALVRWHHPVHGLMPPAEFIELAEVSGLIQPLTRWVIERAVASAASWAAAGHQIGVAANLSVRNLYDPKLAVWLGSLLQDFAVPPERLTLEITETELMDDPVLALEVLSQISALEVTTSVDDFGTGYSSLTYLKDLPISELKIDRTFVSGMSGRESDHTIVRSMIDLGHNLGLDVVAEGVEDAETLHNLVQLGCDRAQGFHLARPLPQDELLAWLDRYQPHMLAMSADMRPATAAQ